MFSTSETQAGNTFGGRRDPDGDFFVVVKLCGDKEQNGPTEIHRKSKPLNVKYEGEEFDTTRDATAAGQKHSKIFYIFLRKKHSQVIVNTVKQAMTANGT